MKLLRYEENPIIAPRENNPWEVGGTFNPAAIRIGNTTYIIYRSVTKNNISVFCLAKSKDCVTVDERLEEPIYFPRKEFEIHPMFKHVSVDEEIEAEKLKLRWEFVSGAGYCGCEDPRITRMGNRLYMTYVCFNGVSTPKVAITSIKLSDFLKERWEWDPPKLISHPLIPVKSCVLFPEKFKNKYLFFHRIFPNIWSDYVSELNFGNGRVLFGKPCIFIRPHAWDSRKIGPGAPPLKILNRWLLVYQGVSGWDPYFSALGLKPEAFKVNDGYRYKIGILCLDSKNPERVIYRSSSPALLPEAWYEGDILYPCGAVIAKNRLFVYYGANDYFTCVASAELSEIRYHLTNGG